jgi:hypothetical protein
MHDDMPGFAQKNRAYAMAAVEPGYAPRLASLLMLSHRRGNARAGAALRGVWGVGL